MSRVIKFSRSSVHANHGCAHDRASVTATVILQIVRSALTAWLQRDQAAVASVRGEVEAVLRAEFDDVVRTTLSEIRREDG
jgi:hypothetical protein